MRYISSSSETNLTNSFYSYQNPNLVHYQRNSNCESYDQSRATPEFSAKNEMEYRCYATDNVETLVSNCLDQSLGFRTAQLHSARHWKQVRSS